jgi:hypothetical protein
MKLIDVVLQGKFCGLETVEECILNFELHMMQIFPYSELERECKELIKDVQAYEDGTLTIDWDFIETETIKSMKEYIAYCEKHQKKDLELEFLR